MLYIPTVLCLTIGIFDAGSTGTRLKVYRFDEDVLVSQKTYKPEEQNTQIEKKGLHEQNKHEIEAMFKEFKHIINVEDSKMQLGFYGTAGMRGISGSKQQNIIKQIREELNGYDLIQAEVLSGKQEAFNTLKAFGYYAPFEDDFTIVDMGGRSVQIVQKIGQNVYIESLEMGVLYSRCTKAGINNRERVFLRKGIELDDIKNRNVDEVLIEHTSCTVDENSYKCSKKTIVNYYRSAVDKREAYGVEKQGHRSETALSGFLANLLKKIGNITNEINLSEVKPESRKFNVLEQVEIKDRYTCIDDFFEKNMLEPLKETKKVFLLSYYEEISAKLRKTTLSRLFGLFDRSCSSRYDSECQKVYYSLQFLKNLGIKKEKNLILINNEFNVDISWSLGKALQIRRLADRKLYK
ncbi:hypothetical protein GINT2_001562 [Glugoides intestinalis]